MRLAPIVIVTVTICAATAAPAEEPKKLVGVLEFANHAGISAYEIGTVTDMVRIAARERLPEKAFVVMTRENLLKLLPPGQSLERCGEGGCEVDVGRQIGADYIVAGEVGKFGSSLQVKMKLYDTRSGDLVAGQIAEAKDLDGLKEPIGTKAAALFSKLSGAQPAAAPVSTQAQEPRRDGKLYPMNPYKMWGHITFWSGLGVGVVGGIAEIVLAASTTSSGQSAVDSSKNNALLGAGIAASGGALMLTGTILWILSPGDEAWANRQKVAFTPVLDPHSAGLVAVGRW